MLVMCTCVQELIARCMRDFPQQTMWQMMAVSNSTFKKRKERCLEIFNAAR